jgi:hypothetical protein
MISNKIFNATTITASGVANSVPIDLPTHTEGFFSLQIALTGDGTTKFEYAISNDGVTYVTQTATADQIVSGFTKTSGPGGDGKDIITFEPEVTKKMKIICTETGTSDSVTITVTLLIR